jgi:TolB-like protein/DNA-binding winged helix-turn-helix (wHTH) protein
MPLPATDRRHAHFGPFEVDFVARELRCRGKRINLQEKPFQVLAILLEQPWELVTREDLRQKLWPADTFVDFEHSINTAVKKVREALEDSGDHPKFIETLPRRGYRFIAPVERSAGRPSVIELVPSGRETDSDLSDTEQVKGQSAQYAVPYLRKAAWISVPVLIVAASVAVIWYQHTPQRNAPPITTMASIAVLPFADLSPGHDHEYFSEGLAEEILNRLTKIPKLKVTARASAFQFKGKNEDPRVVAQKLDVADLLEGSVQRDKDRARVTVRLIKAEDGYDIWSESFDREFKDIFAVEDEIAKAVTSALQLKLLASNSPPTLTTSRTTNPETYEAFLQARYFAHLQDEASAKKALHYANKAIKSDPNYAPAYALRASIQLESGGMTWMDLSEATEKTRHDTEKAIALDPNLADGYRVLSMIQASVELNCPAAETSLKRASDLAPGDPDNLGRSAWLAMCLGRPQQAVELWKQEVLLDPLRPDEYLWLAQSLRDLGRYEEAHAALGKALDLNPNQISMIHEVGGEIYLAQGRPQEALAEMEKEGSGLFHDLGAALVYHALGRRQESDAALARMISQHSGDGAYQIAQVYGYRGKEDQAFEWLNRAYRQHDPGLMWFKTDLKLKSLRKDPRSADLLKKLNLPK